MPSEIDGLIRQKRIVALKLYPGYEFFYPGDACLRPYLEPLVAHGLPAIFHSGDLYSKVRKTKLKYCHPLEIDDLAAELPDLKIVIAHLGYPWMRDAAQVCSKNPNVYADLSGLVEGRFENGGAADVREYLAEFARFCRNPGKLLFGTDWPIAHQGDYVHCTPDVIASCYGTPAVPTVMAGNAARLFGIA